MKIYWTNDAKSQFVSIFIYGMSGAGKTPIAATLPSPIIITTEPGLRSLAHLKLPYVQAITKKEAMDVCAWIKSSNEARQYNSVFFDSISANSENIMAEEKRKSNDPRRFSPATLGNTMEVVNEFLTIPSQSHKHLVMTCKATKNTDFTPGNGTYPVEPLTVVPKLGPALPYHFDEVLYLARYRNAQSGQEYAMFTCRQNDICLARDRSGMLEVWEPANLSHIINKMNGVKTQ